MRNSALLLTSTQNDLLHPSGGAWSLVAATVTRHSVVRHLTELLGAARAAGMPVFHSPVAIDYSAVPAGAEPSSAIQSVILQHRLLAAESFGAAFLEKLAPAKTEIVLPPRQGFSSFWSNNIDALLKERNVRKLYVAGMLAHACVESHVRDAAEHGYQPVVIRDAVGAVSEELQAAALSVLGFHAWEVIDTAQALARFRATDMG
ncbi:MAG TPA: isochorismatase family cysteine hydrolase [Acidobacteriota bacterium]|nr:isochorismatase family cysteine hydrolase [Acidobacteriota bacterium]